MDSLAFSIENVPLWRSTDASEPKGPEKGGPGNDCSITSTRMVEVISDRIEEYERLPQKAHSFCKNAFSRSMVVQYVHHSNIGESVGTQTFEDTLTLLEDVLDRSRKMIGSDDSAHVNKTGKRSRSELESINTFHALRMFHDEVRAEMSESATRPTGMLTVQQLCDVHKVLLKNLHRNNGKLRDTEVYTETEDGIHWYPYSWCAEQRLYSLIDHHNIHMDYYQREQETMATKEKVEFIVKCAARLLFEFVDTHPYCDGNGRMCRLLANYVVSLITPFPVAVYHHPNRYSKSSQRDDYVDAIIKCRKNPQEGPRDLAAMILEGMYLGWESLFSNLQRLDLIAPGYRLGPIVIRKSNLQPLDEKLERVCSACNRSGLKGVTTEMLSEAVRAAIRSEDVSSLVGSLQYKQLLVPIVNEAAIVVDIYP